MTSTMSDGKVPSADAHMRHNRFFSKLVLKENFLTQEMLSECMQTLSERPEGTKIEDIMIEKGYLSGEMVTGIYLKQGILRCPCCGRRAKLPKKLPKRARCLYCHNAFSIPHAYPFMDVKIAPEVKEMCGRSLDGYKIQYCLGSGGMGEVYRALHTRLNRPVALKVLPPHLARQHQYIERFTREARMAAQVADKHLVQMYDVGECEGVHYISMEYIDGISLNQYIPKKKGLEYQEALKILKESAMGLQALHEKNILHRDIKPDNILINNEKIAKLTDFGLAKESSDSAECLTRTGVLIGTPFYMAPEQCLGKKATKQSDIYSLGMTFYLMLVGELPFSGGNALEVITQRMNNPSPELPSEVPAAMRKIYHKMVAENPKQRYKNVAGLLAELDRVAPWKLKKISSSSQKWFPGKLWKNVSPKKKYLLAGVVAMLVLILLVISGSKKAKSQKVIPAANNQENKSKQTVILAVDKNDSEKKPETKKKETPEKEKQPPKVSPDAKAFASLRKQLRLGNLSDREKLSFLQEYLYNFPQSPLAERVKKISQKIEQRIQQKLDERAEEFLQQQRQKYLALLSSNDYQKIEFNKFPSYLENAVSSKLRKRWRKLQEGFALLKQVRQSGEKLSSHKLEKINQELSSILTSEERQVLENYIQKIKHQKQQQQQQQQLAQALEKCYQVIETQLSQRQYSHAERYLQGVLEQMGRFSTLANYSEVRSIIQTEKQIAKQLDNFWDHFRSNLYRNLRPGQNVIPKRMSSDKVVAFAKRMENWEGKREEIGWFYLFEGKPELAQRFLYPVLKKDEIKKKVFWQHRKRMGKH